MFKRILIANRGEIAVRIIRACREMGIESVVVFSDVDRRALHVRKADYAYHIGPATASESYLNVEKILDVARRSQAEAIHPGYGFLSENAGFARACADAGVKFIGPIAGVDGDDGLQDPRPPEHEARRRALRSRLRAWPGHRRRRDGWPSRSAIPVMLKAAAGGGGKGMRMVATPRDLHSAYENAQQRGPALLRRQRGLSREVHRQSAPRRDADLRRRARQRRSISASASAPCSAAIRRCWRSRPRPSWMTTCAAAWARSRSGWPRRPTITTPAPSSSWSIRSATSTSSR